MTRKEFKLLYAIKNNGLCSYRELSHIAGVSLGFISQTLKQFKEKGYVNDKGITESGLVALEPYRVKNAIIMAAGMSSRFVPLSLEKPKGLLRVKGEILIERQIEQLRSVGIKDIVLVLGYKKESFFYLENKYDNITIVINPEFDSKNNTHSLYLAQQYISNSYICSSDNYFMKNPFEDYVYQSYYAAQHVTEKTNEWYMRADSKSNIVKVEKGGEVGDIMLGHVYWDSMFSAAMIDYINDSNRTGQYEQDLWEQILLENVRKLPPMEIRVYPDNFIFEFDSLDELRSFDQEYVNNTHSNVIKNICRIMKCEESDITGFSTIKSGITNTSFVFELNSMKYVYRHSEKELETMISRSHEKKSLVIAKSMGIDPSFLYMDEDEGWKISKYIEYTHAPDYNNINDSRTVINVLRKLHNAKVQVDWNFLPWQKACWFEKELRRKGGGILDPEFNELRNKIEKCYVHCENDKVSKSLCHCDTYASNWLITEDDEGILIDWEYAGNADPGCDVGAYIMDSGWSIDEADWFIREYCGENYSEKLRFHYLAYTAITAYMWYLWALYQESIGVIMGESIYNWRVSAMKFSSYLIETYNI